MTARFALIATALVAAAVAGGAVLRRRAGPPLLPDLTGVRRVGRKAARNLADDWDSLFI